MASLPLIFSSKTFQQMGSRASCCRCVFCLLNALSYIRDGDVLTVQEVDRLGRNLLEGLIVLNDLFQRGVGVKVLEGIAAGEHTERSLILDLALALAEDPHVRQAQ
ncbi:recombinase family protein [Microbispora sp. H10836]|uniref:recombinase family protein n=1 Tax=Microbispora sp. H10836 TaxID=2729106 RepID=UPI0028930279|nr:recombinase family protein [Microbispora sp. H10836]